MIPEGYSDSTECFEENWNSSYCEDCNYIDECEGVSNSCGYWRIPRRGRKCGECNACMDEGDRKVQAWKEGER